MLMPMLYIGLADSTVSLTAPGYRAPIRKALAECAPALKAVDICLICKIKAIRNLLHGISLQPILSFPLPIIRDQLFVNYQTVIKYAFL